MDIKLILYTIPNSLFNFRFIKVMMRELPLWNKFIFFCYSWGLLLWLWKLSLNSEMIEKLNYSLSSPHYAGLSGCVYISSVKPIFSFKEKKNHVSFFMNTITVSSDYSSERHSMFSFPKYLLYNEVEKIQSSWFSSITVKNKNIEKERCKLWANSNPLFCLLHFHLCYLQPLLSMKTKLKARNRKVRCFLRQSRSWQEGRMKGRAQGWAMCYFRAALTVKQCAEP